MKMTVYLDVYFLVNAAMDMALLILTGRIMGISLKRRRRLLLGALVGAACACLELVLAAAVGPQAGEAAGGWGRLAIFPWIGRGMSCFGVGSLMILAAFGRQKPGAFVRYVVALWIVSAAAGGFCGAIEEMTGADYGLTRLFGLRVWRQWTLARFGCVAAAVFFLGSGCIRLMKRVLCERNAVCLARLYYRGRTREVTALMDTGNRLTEPYGGRPVHVITAASFRGLSETVSGLIYIPFCSVGKERGLLPATRIDRIEIIRDGNVIHTWKQPWLAIVKAPLSPEHQYEMLLNTREG